jgi:hypothetical protein
MVLDAIPRMGTRMTLWDITTWYSSKKIRQLDWPKNRYFVVIEEHLPEYVSGFIYWENGKRSVFDFYFGGKSLWEIYT